MFGNKKLKDRFELVQRVEFIKERCRGKNVLHLGCTNYPYTEESISNDMLLHFELEKVARDVTGIDFDEKGLDILRQATKGKLLKADLEQLDQLDLDSKFEVIVAGEMIEHLSNPGLFLNGVKRFMRPGTELILTTVNAYCAMRFFIYGLCGKGGKNEPVHPDHVSYYSYKTLKLAAERQGLQIKAFYFYDLGKEHRPFNRWIYNLLNDLSVKVSPQLADGIIAVAALS